jgi:hypothetical protein
MVKGVPSDKVGLPFFCFSQRRKDAKKDAKHKINKIKLAALRLGVFA